MATETTAGARVYVVLVNFGDPADTLECLETVFRLDHSAFHVIVCDNGATDASVTAITDWAAGRRSAPVKGRIGHELTATPLAKPIPCEVLDADLMDRHTTAQAPADDASPELTVIRSARNRGFAGGNNLGLRYGLACGDAAWFWLLNNDTVVPPDSLRALVSHCATRPQIGQCGSTILYYDTPERLQAMGGGRYNPWLGRVTLTGFQKPFRSGAAASESLDFVHGASMLVSRNFVQTVGLMDERYFLYFEELDWNARSAGRFALGHAPSSIVFHKEGSSAGSASRRPAQRSRLADYHSLRSRMIFTARHRPWALPTVWLGLFLVLLNRIRRRQWDRLPMVLGLMAGRL